MGAFSGVPSLSSIHVPTAAELLIITNLLAAAGLDGGLVDDKTIVKPGDQTYTLDATLNNDTDFQWNLQASATYALHGMFEYVTAATPLFNVAWTVPASANAIWATYAFPASVTATNTGVVDLTAHTMATTLTLGTNGANTIFQPVGRITTVNAGTLIFRHCQSVSNGATTGMLAGSWCSLRRIA